MCEEKGCLVNAGFRIYLQSDSTSLAKSYIL